MLRCLKYTSLNSKLLVIYFANFVELGGYCPKTGYFRFLSFIPNSCHKTLINVTFERGSEKVTFFPWFWYMILPTTNNELGNKTRKKKKWAAITPVDGKLFIFSVIHLQQIFLFQILVSKVLLFYDLYLYSLKVVMDETSSQTIWFILS